MGVMIDRASEEYEQQDGGRSGAQYVQTGMQVLRTITLLCHPHEAGSDIDKAKPPVPSNAESCTTQKR